MALIFVIFFLVRFISLIFQLFYLVFDENLAQTWPEFTPKKRAYENDFINPSNTVFYAVGPPGHDPGTP
jgi:hypothetical protein